MPSAASGVSGFVPVVASAAVDFLEHMASLRDHLLAQGKAFNPHPALEDPGRTVGTVDLNLGRIRGQSPSSAIGGKRVSQKNAKRHTSAYAGREAMDWVMNCVRYWADTVATAEYHFEKPKEPTAEKKPGEAITPPPGLYKLLKKPNPYQDYIEMMELLVMDLLLVGNCYLFKWRTNAAGQPLALYRLAPPYVEIMSKSWGAGGYEYQIPGADKLEMLPEEVIHLKLANPDGSNPYYGAGIIQGAGRAADLEIALTHTQQAYYENQAMPSVAVESERRVPRDVFKKMRQQLRRRAQGPANAGELLILEAGLKLSAIAPNAADAAFAAVSKMSRDRVYSWFKMHPSMTGLVDGNLPQGFLGEVTKNWSNTAARPFIDKVQTKMTEELAEAWKVAYVIDFEYQLTPKERAELGGVVGSNPGFLVNEVRKAAGYEDHPEKEIGEMTLNLPGEEGGTGNPGDPSEKGFADRNLPGEPGRPPSTKQARTKAFPKKGQPLPAGARARKAKAKKASGKALIDGLLEDLDSVLAEGKAVETPHEREPVDLLEHHRIEDVDTVTEGFVGDLRTAAHVLERGLLDTVEGKAVEDYGDIVAKLRNSDAWGDFDALAKTAYERALLQVMSRAAIHHGELGMRPAGEIDYEKMIDDLATRSDSGVAAITKSFKDTISASAKAARAEKADINAAVQEGVRGWTEVKAPMIALTEATRGYNEATLAVADEMGYDSVYVSDGREDDEPCQAADGNVWTTQYAREHALEHPRCRRAFVPIPS